MASICLNFQTLSLMPKILVTQAQREATKECDQKIFLIKEQTELSQLSKALFHRFLQQSYKVGKANKIQ